jgi:hypothetical protein
MIAIKNIEQYNNNCVYFCEPIKNNIVKNGHFIRIIYSNDFVSFNGIYLLLDIAYTIGSIYYNKVKFNFDTLKHNDILTKIQNIEINLLSKLDIINKTPQYNIYDSIKNGYIKIIIENSYKKDHKNIVLKIAGVWETNTEYGLTYKFVTI